MWSLPAHQPEEGEGDDDGDHEATAAGADLVDPRLQLLGKLVVFVAHGYILIGTELTCKGGIGMIIRGQSAGSSTEFRLRITEEPARGIGWLECRGQVKGGSAKVRR